MMRIMLRCCAIACVLGLMTSKNTALAADEGLASKAAHKVIRVDDEWLLSSVRPLHARESFDAHGCDERTQGLLQQYYDSVLDWGQVLRQQFVAVPGHPDWGYYGDGDHREDAVRPICYAVCSNAFLAELDPPSARLDDTQRDQFRSQAIAAMHYLIQSHRSGGGACLNGRPWGNQWQSAMWARWLGMGAWLLWEKLDRPTRLGVARVVEYEADRFIDKKPKSSLKRDTGAEENAWNAGMVSLACCMMPDHPRAEAWDRAAKRYLYNTFSVAADKQDASMGDDGRRVNEWVTTVNAHPDLTLENHGLVHVGYLKNSHAMVFEAATPYVMTDRPVPRACLHHMDGVLDILLDCTAWEGAPICFGGNDWKLVHTQCSDVICFALSGVLLEDPRAACVAATALDRLRRIQEQHKGYYTDRKDPEHNGFVVARLMTCYLVFAKLGSGVEPISLEQLNQQLTGVRHRKYGKAILHRTPTKFVSFAWGSNRMALAMPEDGSWVVWPHFASYLGLVDGEDGSTRSKAALVDLNPQIEPSRFAVTGALERLGGKVTQNFSFASLEKDIVVYVERLRVGDGFEPKTRETGVIGHEYPLGENTRTIFGRFGRKDVVALGNRRAIHTMETDWLNIGSKVGYVIRRGAGRRNVVRYHDETAGHGRVPKLQEWLSLIGDDDVAPLSEGGDWACIVTFLNQSPERTARWAERVRFEVDGDTATCWIGNDVVRTDFVRKTTEIQETSP